MRLLMVGCGNMGYAMLSAWIASGKLAPADCMVVEPNTALRERAAASGVSVFAGADDIAGDARPDLVVFAVKPQVMEAVVPSYKRFAEAGAAFLSIAAGTRIELFEKLLGSGTPVIRCMPNTPAAIGQGMMVVFANEVVQSEVSDAVAGLLSANGAVTGIASENLMDAVTAVSGSGPAYVFHFIECLTAAAEKAGLPAETAALLARQTVLGAAELAAQSPETPAVLRQQVTSPNGTTAAALGVLMGEDRLKNLIGDAVEAARLRSMELGK
ncbi:MAG: pyrroline-5-carboxylate reductase [Notoacmeibacter sp.]|nr:pyrroline-5-carboxylate reductase [Notoacmeibacter sp.]